MSEVNKRLIVVLGMHRSGTSAIARGLKVLGVELGNNLLAPLEGNNPKGFIEDVDINSLNIEMLRTLGSDWHYLAPIQPIDVQRLQTAGYLLRATELLRGKLHRSSTFGFKDPRVAKLLPFWILVFKQLQLDVSFLLAIRHPLSVVRSLEKRDGLDSAKVYLLWLDHVISSLACTAGYSRIVVDYDRVVNAPNDEFLRLSKNLNLAIDSIELRNYGDSFLDNGLRHTVYHLNDLLLDPSCPALVFDIWSVLVDLASDKLTFENSEFQRNVDNWVRECGRLIPSLTYIDYLLSEKESLFHRVKDSESRNADSLRSVSARDAHIRDLTQSIESLVLDRDAQKSGVAQLQRAAVELGGERDRNSLRAQQLTSDLSNLALHHESLTRNHEALTSEFALLMQHHASTVRDDAAKLDHLNSLLEAGRGQIELLRNTVDSLVADRDAHQTEAQLLRSRWEDLSKQVREYALQLQSTSSELATVYRSKSWRLTAPMRHLMRVLTGPRNPSVNSTINTPLVDGITENIPGPADPKKHRILLVSHYCPTRAHAGGLRILDIYHYIRKQCPEIQLDIFTYIRPAIDWSTDDVYDIFDNVYLSPIDTLSPDMFRSLPSTTPHYDVIDLQFHQSGQYVDSYRDIGAKIIFTPMESMAKAEFIKLSACITTGAPIKLREVAASVRLVAEEISYSKKADNVVCVSRADAAFLRIFAGTKKVRGMDTGISSFEFSDAMRSDFACTPPRERRCSILYIAYFGSDTNVKALQWYLDNVHPIIKQSVSGYVLTVAGRGDMSPFSRYRDRSIEFLGEVDALSPCIKAARVGIAPALSGSGLRGKVNQYAIEGIPSVVSPIAHKGLAYKDGETIFVADSPELFAARCISLLTDLELNAQMGRQARRLCMNKYSWSSKWRMMQSIYDIPERASAI